MSTLNSLRILDFSTLLPGPYATMLMADMGADIIKVEHPLVNDLTQQLPPIIDGMSALYSQLNRNKKSLTLDLKHPASREIIQAIIQDYDIIIEQFRPGVMASLGLDYLSLKEYNPDIIYCSISGYGQTGPYSKRAGHDINYLAISGIASYSGTETTGPSLSGIQIADMAGGSHHAVMSILAAVIHRQQTGNGQFIDISMTDCAFSMNIISGAPSLADQNITSPEFESELLNGGFFYDYYPTADGKFLSIGGLEPKFLTSLSELLNIPELIKYALSPDKATQKALKQQISTEISKRNLKEWQNILADKDICAEPVLTIKEAANHPQLKSRDMVKNYKTLAGNSIQQIAPAIKLKSDIQHHQNFSPAPNKGKDTLNILRSYNFSESQINELTQQRCISIIK
jgi:crotonobetainyl-CoA:carnitine CoA-transferase CaiB-like acyl-CoA transferase